MISPACKFQMGLSYGRMAMNASVMSRDNCDMDLISPGDGSPFVPETGGASATGVCCLHFETRALSQTEPLLRMQTCQSDASAMTWWACGGCTPAHRQRRRPRLVGKE